MDICPPMSKPSPTGSLVIEYCQLLELFKPQISFKLRILLDSSVQCEYFFGENNTFRAELRGEESNIHRAEGGGAVHCQGYHHRQWQNIVPGTGPGHIT